MRYLIALLMSSVVWAGPSGEADFQKVKAGLLKHYYRESLTEDEIYRAAIRGMLKELDPELAEWNRVLSPQEASEMQNDLSGEIVGAGVEIRFDAESGQSEVLYVIPGSPAEKAGVVRGDRVLSVDGKRFEGKNLGLVVEAIRGKEGDRRRLTLLRKDEVLTKTLRLTKVPYAEVGLQWPANGQALVTLNYFTESTPARLEKALGSAKNAKSLIIDLRGNSGGGLEAALASASLLVPKGQPIVTVRKRGEREEALRSTRDPIAASVPLVVLMDEETKSAAEFFAMALKEQRGATLVGKKTFGKWTFQKVDRVGDLAVKYTVGLVKSSKGLDFGGKGVVPDLEVGLENGLARKLQRLPDMAARLEKDAPLRAALKLSST